MVTKLITVTITFLILDALWLGLIAKKLYIQELSSLVRISNGVMQPLWSAAIIVYIALIAGILLFVLPKAQSSILLAGYWGGLFGLISYAIYDFTNLSTLKGCTLKIAIVDTLWGCILCALTSIITVWITN